MNPVAFEIFGLEVRWYGILIALGALIGILFTYFILKRNKDFNEDTFFNLMIITILSGFIGARLYFVVFNFGDYHSLWDVLNIRSGGLAFHGGLIFGTLAFFLYGRAKKLDLLTYLDALSVGVLFAYSLGRWGNFFNQEAHGGPVSLEFIQHFPQWIQEGMLIDGVYYHPTFLYESINNLIWFAVLAFLLIKKVKLKKGTVLALAVFGNSLCRFFTEGLRTDSLYIGPFRVAQLVAIIGVLCSVLYLIYLYLMKREKKIDS